MYVTDTAADRVQRFTSGGLFLASYGTPGSGHNEFDDPVGAAFDGPSGWLYVVDRGNHRVQKLTGANDRSDEVSVFGAFGTGDFLNAAAETVDPSNGNVYISDGDDVE